MLQNQLRVTYRSKQVISGRGGAERLRLPIYHLDIELAYFKAKAWRKIDTSIVSFIDDKDRILKDDFIVNSKLNDDLYGSKFKGQRGLRIDKIHSKKQVGITNW